MRNFGHLYCWNRNTNNASRRIQAFDTVRYGTLIWKNSDNFWIPQTKGDILTQLKQQIDTDIEILYQIVAEQERSHTVCITVGLQQGENPFGTAPH